MSRNSRFPFSKRKVQSTQTSSPQIACLSTFREVLAISFVLLCTFGDQVWLILLQWFQGKEWLCMMGLWCRLAVHSLVFASRYWACCCSYEANAAKSWCSAAKIYNSAGLLFIMWLLCPAALVIWCILSIRSLVKDW